MLLSYLINSEFAKLVDLTFDERRQLLRLVFDRIEITDKKVRIDVVIGKSVA